MVWEFHWNFFKHVCALCWNTLAKSTAISWTLSFKAASPTIFFWSPRFVQGLYLKVYDLFVMKFWQRSAELAHPLNSTDVVFWGIYLSFSTQSPFTLIFDHYLLLCLFASLSEFTCNLFVKAPYFPSHYLVLSANVSLEVLTKKIDLKCACG